MPTYHFTGPSTRREYSGKCPTCGKRAKRSKSFENTVNPFNRNEDGTVKTWEQVAVDVQAMAGAGHGRCVGAGFRAPDVRRAACGGRGMTINVGVR